MPSFPPDFSEKPLPRELPAARQKRFHGKRRQALPAMPLRLFRLFPADKTLHYPSLPFRFGIPEGWLPPFPPQAGPSGNRNCNPAGERLKTGIAQRISSRFTVSASCRQAPLACRLTPGNPARPAAAGNAADRAGYLPETPYRTRARPCPVPALPARAAVAPIDNHVKKTCPFGQV